MALSAKRGEWPWLLLLAVGFLVTVGVAVLFAIEEGATNEVSFSPGKHLLHLGIGLAVATVVAFQDYRIWKRLANWMYFASILLLIVLLVTGGSGAGRWIDLGFIQFQPSELAKLACVLLLAKLFSNKVGQMSSPKNLLLSVAYIALPAGLTLLQPDLGTAIIFVAIWAVMVLVSDVKLLYIAFGSLLIVFVSLLAIPQLEDYQQQRIMTFLDPAADPQGTGYNLRQARITIGSGGVVGQGLDSGSQSQLAFLPAQHTDFVFAVVAEKLGFIGAVATIAAFVVVVWQMIKIGLRAQDSFGGHVAIGLAALIAIHVMVNIGMNLGLLPVTGLPLPFISYGGTYLVIALSAVGIAVSISRSRRGLAFEK